MSLGLPPLPVYDQSRPPGKNDVRSEIARAFPPRASEEDSPIVPASPTGENFSAETMILSSRELMKLFSILFGKLKRVTFNDRHIERANLIKI